VLGFGEQQQPPTRGGLTQADLVAARQREPAAVTRVYTAYAPALYRFFMAEVGNRQEAQDLTGSVFVSVIEALPGFRGPVEALGGWLFRIARHDLYDFKRKQAHPSSLAASEDDTPALLQAIRVLVDNPDAAPPAALPQLVRRLLHSSSHTVDAPLHRLSPRERQVLVLLERGWSPTQISRELYVSPHTVRTHVENLLQKLEMHATQEAATVELQHLLSLDADDPAELSIEQPEDSRILVALQQLPPDQREVLLLRMASGLTAPEVAAALHKTIGAVKALQHRGLASLAGVLGLRGSNRDDAAARLRVWLRRPQPPHRADPTPGHQQGQAGGPPERADPRTR
jgi:RNA polymerase sigma factor (sigma-70 family)